MDKKKIEFNDYDNHEFVIKYSELIGGNQDIAQIIQFNRNSPSYTYSYSGQNGDLNLLTVSENDKELLRNINDTKTCKNFLYDGDTSISCNQEMSKEKIEAIIPNFPEKESILNEINKLNNEVKFDYTLNESFTHRANIEIIANGPKEEVKNSFDTIWKKLEKYENVKINNNHILIDTNDIDMNIKIENDELIYRVEITKAP
ncbi:MAG: hypothetical protein RR700_03350 [Anaerorhabdus sp.]